MTVRSATVGGHRYAFVDLKDLLAKATPLRSGDVLAGVAATSAAERVAAQLALSDVPLTAFLDELVVPYEVDDVTRLIVDSHDAAAFSPVSGLTVGELRDHLLAGGVVSPQGLMPEMAAAVSKLMRNQDLISVARRLRVVTTFRTTIGLPGRLATRLQPNSPTDDPREVLAAIVDGLLFGCGDAVVGINPASDSPRAVHGLLTLIDEVRQRYAVPMQSCVLSHVTTTIDLLDKGSPVDLVFQSIAGTQGANEGFGVTLDHLAQAKEGAEELGRGGPNVMYFETGQGTALSADAHHGVDQQTLECRSYAVARAFDPLLVNTVVGFIGPEYLYDGKQIVRAGLEDHFCGKLLGLPMGVDVCYTNHAEADQDDMDNLLTLLSVAGTSFVITVPGSDDVMLGYQTLSYHDALYAREVLGLRPAPEFESWLQGVGLLDSAGRVPDPRTSELARRALKELA